MLKSLLWVLQWLPPTESKFEYFLLAFRSGIALQGSELNYQIRQISLAEAYVQTDGEMPG